MHFNIKNKQRLFLSLLKCSKRSRSSSTSNLFIIEDDYLKSNGYLTLKMNSAPVNKMDLEFLTQFNKHLDHFENDDRVKGIIITSVCHFSFLF
jgi:enoyl-CoA hydratase/carnithine racemase